VGSHKWKSYVLCLWIGDKFLNIVLNISSLIASRMHHSSHAVSWRGRVQSWDLVTPSIQTHICYLATIPDSYDVICATWSLDTGQMLFQLPNCVKAPKALNLYIYIYKIAQSFFSAGYLLQNCTTNSGGMLHADTCRRFVWHRLGLLSIGVIVGKKIKLS